MARSRFLFFYEVTTNLKMNDDDDDYMIFDAVMLLYSAGDPYNDVVPLVEEEEVRPRGRRGQSQPGKAPNIDRRRLFYAKLLKRMPRLATCKIGFSTGGERIYREKRQFHDLCKICPK